jgi:hypothetical protein
MNEVFSQRKSKFNSRSVLLGFVIEKVFVEYFAFLLSLSVEESPYAYSIHVPSMKTRKKM